MRIRPVQPADREEWLRMRKSLWPDYMHQQVEDDIALYFVNSTIWGQTTAAYVLERDVNSDYVGGFVEVSLRSFAKGCTTSPVGYIEAWYVDPDLRKSGHGKALLAEAENWARSRGCTEMASDCSSINRVSYLSHLQSGYEPTIGGILFRKPLIEKMTEKPQDDWIAIVPFELAVATAMSMVNDGHAGGIDVFLGTTRAEKSQDGRDLIALDYEAYEQMALDQMKQLAHRAREKWPIIKLALLHRVGRVPVGEPSVIIAVSTPHRADAFEACRFLIDELKKDVAIWKKEVWSDGSASWVHPGPETRGQREETRGQGDKETRR